MYVREKKIRRGEKTYSYWQVVQGTRVDGKVRQTVVHHLGSLMDNRDQADSYARLCGVLCGVPGCGEAATEELAFYSLWDGARIPVTSTVAIPIRGRRVEREFPYLLCPAHVEAWRNEPGKVAMHPAIFDKKGQLRG